jgi:23S rRNA (cytosine1962-C5)-methyltransferase
LNLPAYTLLEAPRWKDYQLLDSGDGLKLERFGGHRFARPEVQALWKRSLPEAEWAQAEAVFVPSGEESGGHWKVQGKLPAEWEMTYPLEAFPTGKPLRFSVTTTPGRHLGVFPEGAAHWDWMAGQIRAAARPVHALNLFGYTGLASLACAAAGARVTHVDASRKSVDWARQNQALSGLADKPIRWLVDDALKFVQREARRGTRYDGLILDPPKFGRGPKGEVWEVYKSLPALLAACRAVLSERPLFAVLTVYAVRASALHLAYALQECLASPGGRLECGELVTREASSAHRLSQAVYARWNA